MISRVHLKTTYRRRFLFNLLLVALVGIWASVFITVFEQVDGSEALQSGATVSVEQKPIEGAGPSPRVQPYSSDYKDPFEPAASVFFQPQPVNSRKDIAVQENKGLPQITLLGITGITATVNGSNDLVYFVKPGDSVEGVQILQVIHDHVLAKYEEQTLTLKIKP